MIEDEEQSVKNQYKQRAHSRYQITNLLFSSP
jgi:hypothetical protein